MVQVQSGQLLMQGYWTLDWLWLKSGRQQPDFFSWDWWTPTPFLTSQSCGILNSQKILIIKNERGGEDEQKILIKINKQ